MSTITQQQMCLIISCNCWVQVPTMDPNSFTNAYVPILGVNKSAIRQAGWETLSVRKATASDIPANSNADTSSWCVADLQATVQVGCVPGDSSYYPSSSTCPCQVRWRLISTPTAPAANASQDLGHLLQFKGLSSVKCGSDTPIYNPNEFASVSALSWLLAASASSRNMLLSLGRLLDKFASLGDLLELGDANLEGLVSVPPCFSNAKF